MSDLDTPHSKDHITSMERFSHEREKIPWDSVEEFCSAGRANKILDKLTSTGNNPIPDEKRDVRALMYYLYSTGGNNTADDVYKKYFERAKEPEHDIDLSEFFGSEGQVITQSVQKNIIANLFSDKTELRSVAISCLGLIKAAAKDHGIQIVTASILNNTTYTPDQAGDLFIEIIKVLKQIVAEKKKISRRPINGLDFIYLAMRQEHEGKGITDSNLHEKTAEDFARFAVGVTTKKFGSGEAPKPHDRHEVHEIKDLLPAYREDLKGLVEVVTERVNLRTASDALLAARVDAFIRQFPVFKGLTAKSDFHAVEHALKHLDVKDIAKLIAYLRHLCEEKNAFLGRGIAETDLQALNGFVMHLEDMCAEKIATKIKEKSPAEAWKSATEIVEDSFDKPMAQFKARKKETEVHLKTLKPHEEHDDGKKKDFLHNIPAIATTVLAIKEMVDIVRGLSGRKKPEKKEASSPAEAKSQSDHH